MAGSIKTVGTRVRAKGSLGRGGAKPAAKKTSLKPSYHRYIVSPEQSVFYRIIHLFKYENLVNWKKKDPNIKKDELLSWLEDFNKRHPASTVGDFLNLSKEKISQIPGEEDRQKIQELFELLPHIKGTKLLETFGPKIFPLIHSHYPVNGKQRYRVSSLLEKNGYNLKAMTKATGLVAEQNNASQVNKAFHMLKAKHLTVLNQALPGFIQACKTTKDSVDTKNFSIEVINPASLKKGKHQGRPTDYFNATINDKHFSFYLDAPIALMLKYNDEPVGVVATKANKKDPRVLEIHQIQLINAIEIVDGSIYQKKPNSDEFKRDHRGEKITNKTIRPDGIFKKRKLLLDFRKLLVCLAECWGQLHGFQGSMIQGAVNNIYTKPKKNGEVRLPLERAEAIYDGTADKLGYRFNKADGNWYKKIA